MYEHKGRARARMPRLRPCCGSFSPAGRAKQRWVQVTKEEYVRVGSVALGQQLQRQLQKQGLNPTVIPVGGSNSLGTWGYLEAAQEMAAQEQKFTDIVMVGGPLTRPCDGTLASVPADTALLWRLLPPCVTGRLHNLFMLVML